MEKRSAFCPRCNSSNIIKYGKSKDRQIYLCKDCKRKFVENPKKAHRGEEVRREVLRLFAQGMSMLSISKRLGIPYTTTRRWIVKSLGKEEAN